MKTKRQTGVKGKADRLFSQLVRSDGRCEYGLQLGGECSGVLQCAHIISRRFSATRTDLNNAWSLCAGHHMAVDQHAGLKMMLVGMTISEDMYWDLYHKAHDFQGRMDWAAECERLSALLKEAEAA